MRDSHAYDYAVIRLVPHVAREEFMNVGVLLSCPARAFLGARLHLEPARLHAFAPDLDDATILAHLQAFDAICRGGPDAGPIGELPARQRFHWLVAPRSTVIQTSAPHTGLCTDPAETLEKLVRRYVATVGRSGSPSPP